MFGPKFLASVSLAVLCAGGVSAFTSSPLHSSQYATHQVRHIGRGLRVESFHPESTYEVSRLFDFFSSLRA
jgi:extracellular elastinolytic metalloproteinase